MPRNCCCGKRPRPEAFCCNDIFFTDFITLYGDNLAEHAEVSPKDWIALYISRDTGEGTNSYLNRHNYLTNSEYECQCYSPYEGCGSVPYYRVLPTASNPALAEQLGRRACCQQFLLYTSEIPKKPIYFAYKYTGCHLIWYPREFAFNDPYITQCNAFKTTTYEGVPDYPPREVVNSCHRYSKQVINVGSAGGAPPECNASGVIYQNGTPVGISYLDFTPCACSSHPHIHGGLYDSLYNRMNIKLTPGQLGYVPFLLPFAPPMKSDEAECCWCANSTGIEWDAFVKNRRACFVGRYPFSDGSGRTLNINDQCGPGFDCRNLQNSTYSSNPGYSSYCFKRGISPYLWRLSKENNKMAHSIWGYGFPEEDSDVSTPNYIMDFGVSYEVRNIQIIENTKNIELEFKKFTGKRTRLRDQLVGIVHLEHHFEMYAYRSDIGSAALEIQALQNHCNILIDPYEQYGGAITKRGAFYRWTPWKFDNIMWQVRRSVPRRVMYKGSGIPLFQFDLVQMENKSYEKNIIYQGDPFDGATFLKHYYRYFFGLTYFNEGQCKFLGDTPVAAEWDFSHFLDSYEYVVFWLEKMVEVGVLRIKDHAIDISTDVNRLIAGAQITSDGQIAVLQEVAREVGGYSGYIDLVNFFGVTAGTINATTPKIIKNKLLPLSGQEKWEGPSGNNETFRAFLPRKAILPVSQTLNGITSWGFTGPIAFLEGTQYGITGSPSLVTDALEVPRFFDREDVRDIVSPQKIVSGLMANFIIDASGKIFALGSADLEEGQGCGENEYTNWPPRIGCIPWYLRISEIWTVDPDSPAENQRLIRREPENIPDGSVINIAFKRDFVVAQLDTFNSALGRNCNLFNSGNLGFIEAYEDSSPSDQENAGPDANVNGNNETFVLSYNCMPDDPFFSGSQGVPPVNAGPRGGFGNTAENRKPNAYRLKSWGSKAKQYGTFSGSKQQASSEYSTAIQYLRWNSEINPIVDGEFDSKKYPGNNNFHIWTEISSGVKHFAAIDDRNGLFITPGSDNTFNQSKRGMGVTYYSGYKQAQEIKKHDENIDTEAWLFSGHIRLGSQFNYFPHIPKPGYVKDEEWTQSFYNNITLAQAYDGGENHYRINIGQCPSEYPDDNCRAGSGFLVPQDECPVIIYPLNDCEGNCGPYGPEVRDLTTVLMGNLVTYKLRTGEDWVTAEKGTQPKYTKVACGTYNTLCLTNENKLEIYGTYLKVTPEGEPLINEQNPGITAFIPSAIQAMSGRWNVTYACPVYCHGATHSPIIDYEYIPPADDHIIKEIYSSSDYSICVTANNKVHIWGDVSMIPGLFDPLTYTPGNIGYRVLEEINDVNQIVSIAAGINSFYIHYKKQLIVQGDEIPLISSVTYEFTRYNINGIATEVPTSIRSAKIIDIGAGYFHAMALYSSSLNPKTWDFESFSKLSKNFQFKDFDRLPYYLRRYAFFHSLPGGWDYSKWLYGSICCNSLETPNSNPVLKQDPCSVLRYNVLNNTEDSLLSYSGNPHYFWHRQDWRRTTTQSTDLLPVEDDPTQPNKCRPDVGLNVQDGQASFNSISSLFGDCLRGYGPVWGTARPKVNNLRRDTIKAVPSCRPDCQGYSYYINSRPQFALGYLTFGVDIPPTIGYRATKDLFQKMTLFYGNGALNNTASTSTDFQFCPAVIGYGWSYFKYAERHYYLGYNREEDTWDIYENPDFLKETAHAQIDPDIAARAKYDKFEIGATGWNECVVDGITSPVRIGFGGGGTQACCNTHLDPACTNNWDILRDYPLSGPNYPMEHVTETPVVSIAKPLNLHMDLTLGDLPPQDTNPTDFCPFQSCTSASGIDGIRESIGPGGFMFTGGRQGQLGYGFNNLHVYNLTIKRTEYPRQILKGVGSNLSSATIPPNLPNTDYIKKSFNDVLIDPNLTVQENPWGINSTKWTPICWRTPTLIEGNDITVFTGKDLYFNYSIIQDVGDNLKQISDEQVKEDDPKQIEYKLRNLPIIEPEIIPPPNDPEWSVNDSENIRLIETFITDPDVPNSLILRKGLFQFFIIAKPKYGSMDPMFLFVQVLKYNPKTQTETLILETPREDVNIADLGSLIGVDPSTPDDPSDRPMPFKEFRISYYLGQDIQLEESDRIMVKILLKGGIANDPDPDLPADDPLYLGESVFILYEDKSNFTVRLPDEELPVDTGISRYTRMKHSILVDEVNEVCIASFSPLEGEDPSIIDTWTRATTIDPNIVRLVYDKNGALLAPQGPVAFCGLIPCCGD